MNEITISKEIIEEHGLSEFEYKLILKLLGREPNITELGIFSVMWSEHCSYKNSKPLLKIFSTKHERILVGAGEENAGVVDIGDGWGLVFKVESHNHPSAVEPYQGAATGVGGIIRDIFTMGARPIACMDSLRFGLLSDDHMKFLLKGVVSGIAGYGNCIGIPTIGGEIMFDESYQANPLVNVFCLGVVRNDEIARGSASGIGNCVLYVGPPTGRDGIHGATFASDDLTKETEEKKSAVQVGDPFMEKLLLEACLDVIKKDLVVGIQDMGAAGLTCSTCETASRGKSGISIDVAKVPQRETGMTTYEIMLSESQERMLLIVKPENVTTVKEIFKRWDLHAENIGQVEEGDRMKVYNNGVLEVDIPVEALTEDAPIYIREEIEPAYLKDMPQVDLTKVVTKNNYTENLETLLAAPNIASKAWVYEQYDHMVGTNTVSLPGSDAAVIRIKETNKLVAMKLDGQGRYCYVDPYEGGKIAVAEAARNVVCSGARPIASTDCLNFGNPMIPEVFWVFHHCVDGVSDACRALDTPVLGGNVSLYNQNSEGSIFPTPIIGVVGMMNDVDDIAKRMNTQWFKNEGDIILLLGDNKEELGASEFYKEILGETVGPCPKIDLKVEYALYDAVIGSSEKGLLQSAHDCSEGGLAVALAESCMSGPKSLGAQISLKEDFDVNTLLFGETQSRIVVSCCPNDEQLILDICSQKGVPVQNIGQVEGQVLIINDWININLQRLKSIWTESLEQLLQ